MSGALMIAVGGTAYAGLTALCTGFDRHYRQLRPGQSKPSQRLQLIIRAAGWALLTLSLWISVRVCGTGIGWVAWFGVLSAMTTVLALQLAYAPRRILPLTKAAGVTSLLVAIANQIPL